jgi:hypothetical protein
MAIPSWMRITGVIATITINGERAVGTMMVQGLSRGGRTCRIVPVPTSWKTEIEKQTLG